MRLRNRIVKATAWTDGDLLRWHRDKRDFYRSLWACAEDSCCIVDDMFEVKLTAWPSPMDADFTVERLEAWRDDLIACGKLVPYEVDGKRYLYIPSMAEHEKPRNPQPPDWPLPPWVTYAVVNEGKNRRCTYTFAALNGHRAATVQNECGNRTATVQNECGNRKGSPALPCPDQPCPAQSVEHARPDEKVIKGDPSPLPCLDKPIAVTWDGHEYTGTCFGYLARRMEVQFGQLPSPSEIAQLRAAIRAGCLDGCTGGLATRCAVHIADKLDKKAGPTFAKSRLWLTTVREDRHEVER